MQAAGDTKTMTVQHKHTLRTTCGHATLESLAEWQQALNLLLASKGHSAHTAYARAPIDINDMRQPDTSQVALLARYPQFGEIDQELLKRTMCTAHGITEAEMALDEHAETRIAIRKAMGTRLLAYEEKRSVIAGITTDYERAHRRCT